MKNLMKINIILITIITLLIGCGDITLEGGVAPAEGVEVEELTNRDFGGFFMDQYIPASDGIQMGINKRYLLDNGVGIMEGGLFLNSKSNDNTFFQPIRVIIIKNTHIYIQKGTTTENVYKLENSKRLAKDLYSRFTTNLYHEDEISMIETINLDNLVKDSDSQNFVENNTVLESIKLAQKI